MYIPPKVSIKKEKEEKEPPRNVENKQNVVELDDSILMYCDDVEEIDLTEPDYDNLDEKLFAVNHDHTYFKKNVE